MPYMNLYLENIDISKNEVHVVYWNRDLKEEDLSDYSNITLHEFACYQEDDVSKLLKISSFLKYRKFAKKIMNQGGFDLVISLHTLPGILVFDKIKKHFKNKFILDYRDSTFEGFAPFKKIVGDLVKWSSATFVSSDGFRVFLPEREKEKIYTTHNLLTDSLSHREDKLLHGTKSEKIRLAFWGFIRYEEINKEIIKKICNDKRFELHYYGREQQTALNLKKYVAEIGAQNIFFHGEYQPTDRYEFIKNTDILNNVYSDNNAMLAMGNKYYDGIIFYIPQLCMSGSFMGERARKAGVGYACNPYDDDFADVIYEYYRFTNREEFNENCDKELARVQKEMGLAIKEIQKITNGGEV